MEPTIRDGDLCIFRARPQGSRQGMMVLVQYRGPADPETGGAFTVKRYRSEKGSSSESEWTHTKITLEPTNRDFQPIVLTPDDEGAVAVAGEFIRVLTPNDSAI